MRGLRRGLRRFRKAQSGPGAQEGPGGKAEAQVPAEHQAQHQAQGHSGAEAHAQGIVHGVLPGGLDRAEDGGQGHEDPGEGGGEEFFHDQVLSGGWRRAPPVGSSGVSRRKR